MKNKFLPLILVTVLSLYANTSWLQTSHLYFDGVNDYVETHNTGLDIMWNDYTFEAVIRGNEDDQGTDPTILSNRWSYIKGNTFFLKDMISGPRALCFSHAGEEYYIPNNGTVGSLLDGECHHVAIVRQGADMLFFADGVLFGELIHPYYYCESLEGYNPIWIGRDHDTDNPFKGVIGKVRVWNIARSADDIADNMYADLDGTESELKGCWELNEGDGQQVYEKTGFGWYGFLGADNDLAGDDNDPDWFIGDYCADISDDDGVEDGQSSGLKNNAIATELTLYPNPISTEVLTIDFGADLNNVSVSIMAFNGQSLFHSVYNDKTSFLTLDIADFSKGIYIVHIQHDQGYLMEKLVVK